MMLHSFDYLDLFGTVVIGWQWLLQAAAAKEGRSDAPFYKGKLQAAQYWIKAELPRIHQLADLCVDAEDSYAAMQPEWF
jgi:butyryl-CoA dehydrogenase